jgi:hypothetical protein
MGGHATNFTHDAIRRAQPFPYLKSKMGTASAASPMLSGNLLLKISVIGLRCCLTCLTSVTSLTRKKLMQYIAAVAMDLFLLEVVQMSCVHFNLLMVKESAYQKQMKMVTILELNMARTSSQTKRMDPSPSLR